MSAVVWLLICVFGRSARGRKPGADPRPHFSNSPASAKMRHCHKRFIAFMAAPRTDEIFSSRIGARGKIGSARTRYSRRREPAAAPKINRD
jgi:hypothetical protein